MPSYAPIQAIGEGSLAERAVVAVRELIHDGELLPGQPIRQVAIAQRLGMSRVPVREALQHLQAEGLVCASTTGGFAVTRLSSAELAQFYLMRRLLETELLRRIEAVPEEELAVLEGLNERMRALVNSPGRTLRPINREFHFRMFRLTGLEHVVAEIGRLWDRTIPYRTVYSTGRAVRARIVDEHQGLIEALRHGDTERLVQAMDAHRGASERDVLDVLTRPSHPDRG